MKDTREKGQKQISGIGERFQEETKYRPESIGGHSLDWNKMPSTYKDYPSPIAGISLPKPRFGSSTSVWEVLAKRRSTRIFEPARTLALGTLSSLLWATQGFTAVAEGWYFRAAPRQGDFTR